MRHPLHSWEGGRTGSSGDQRNLDRQPTNRALALLGAALTKQRRERGGFRAAQHQEVGALGLADNLRAVALNEKAGSVVCR